MSNQALDQELESLCDEIANQAPAFVPELPEAIQAVCGWLAELEWALECQIGLEHLSQDQREILARVSTFTEQELTSKNTDD